MSAHNSTELTRRKRKWRQLNVRVPDVVFDRVRRDCCERNISMAQFLQNMLEDHYTVKFDKVG